MREDQHQRAIIFARETTESRDLQSQVEKLKRFAALNGFNVVDVISLERAYANGPRTRAALDSLSGRDDYGVLLVEEVGLLWRGRGSGLAATLRRFEAVGVAVVAPEGGGGSGGVLEDV